jgi:hypothetical protein
MKKVFHWTSDDAAYVSDAVILGCFDSRFDLPFRKFLQRSGIHNPDVVKVAGGAKCLASPGHESDRDFAVDQINTSIRLHKTPRAILMVHSDCGAYGGLEAFQGDTEAEAKHHEAELRSAAAFLVGAIPQIAVDSYFLNFEGVWKIE